MLPSHPNDRDAQIAHGRRAPARAGFTFVELIASTAILTLTMTVLSGLMLAIGSAWDHATALEESRRQAQAATSRIRWMVQQAGCYRLAGQATTLGVATLDQTWLYYQSPSTLVIWSGGANGGMAAQGLQSRLPLASELVVIAPDSTTPSKLVELTFPGNSTQIDFRASSFASTIRSLMSWPSRQSVQLIDRLRVTPGQNYGWYNVTSVGNSRFELTYSPSDSQLSGVTPGSQAWNDLPWALGLVGANSGLRSANIRIELLLERDPVRPQTDNNYTTALPFFGSATRQFVYQP
jgi:hypothetical protein